MDNSFGKKIQYLREKNDMTQRELATKINISFSVMSRIESGDRAARDEEIIKIAKALNVSTDYLLGNSDIEYPYKEAPEHKTDEDIDLWLSKTDGYKELPKEDRELISNLAKNLLEKHRKEK
jgi:Helix-turn-helix.